jgi:hypothetical protein
MNRMVIARMMVGGEDIGTMEVGPISEATAEKLVLILAARGDVTSIRVEVVRSVVGDR